MASNSGRALLDQADTPEALRRLAARDLPQLADELRAELLDVVSETGGHLGAGLGVVELTIALHYAFETPKAKIIWDVSHQCYPHKLITGRRARMRSIRQGGGLSGFTSRAESDFDPFGAAHSSTAISAGLGFAKGRDLLGDDYDVVAIVGDGAFSAGMCFEGLSNAGQEQSPLIVVLNDNNMSIDPAIGAFNDYLLSLRQKQPRREERIERLKRGELPNFTGRDTMFDNFGVAYAGPFNGHDIEEMLLAFAAAKAARRPIVLHFLTEKGKGYAPAEASADRYHGVAKFDVATGVQKKAPARAPSYSQVFGDALCQLAETDPTIVAITPAMASGSGLNKFWKLFPNRMFDVAIAEQHAVTFAAGLAAAGMRPFAALYSTFLQRGYDQLIHDVAIQNLPVRFAIDRAGMVGADGVTHQGAFDIAYLGCIPNLVMMAAGDESDLARMVATAAAIDDRPSAFRYPRGEGVGVVIPAQLEPLEIGRGRILREGAELAILSFGARLHDALGAAEDLSTIGVDVTVADARFAKPIDDRLVAELFREHPFVLTLEEGSIGGFSAQVVNSLLRQGLSEHLSKLRTLHLPDRFIDHDTPAAQISQCFLCKDSIKRVVTTLLPANRRLRVASAE